MLQRKYTFEVAEGMPSHTVVGRVEATDADSLPENRIINYQLQMPTLPLSNDDSISSNAAATTSVVAVNAALHLFTIDRCVFALAVSLSLTLPFSLLLDRKT